MLWCLALLVGAALAAEESPGWSLDKPHSTSLDKNVRKIHQSTQHSDTPYSNSYNDQSDAEMPADLMSYDGFMDNESPNHPYHAHSNAPQVPLYNAKSGLLQYNPSQSEVSHKPLKSIHSVPAHSNALPHSPLYNANPVPSTVSSPLRNDPAMGGLWDANSLKKVMAPALLQKPNAVLIPNFGNLPTRELNPDNNEPTYDSSKTPDEMSQSIRRIEDPKKPIPSIPVQTQIHIKGRETVEGNNVHQANENDLGQITYSGQNSPPYPILGGGRKPNTNINMNGEQLMAELSSEKVSSDSESDEPSGIQLESSKPALGYTRPVTQIIIEGRESETPYEYLDAESTVNQGVSAIPDGNIKPIIQITIKSGLLMDEIASGDMSSDLYRTVFDELSKTIKRPNSWLGYKRPDTRIIIENWASENSDADLKSVPTNLLAKRIVNVPCIPNTKSCINPSVNIPIMVNGELSMKDVPYNNPTLVIEKSLHPIGSYLKYAQETHSNLKFKCQREDNRYYVKTPNSLTYHCFHKKFPMQLLVEVPVNVRNEPIIEVELAGAYTRMAADAWTGEYSGISQDLFMDELTNTANTIGMAVIVPDGLSSRLITLPVAVPNENLHVNELKPGTKGLPVTPGSALPTPPPPSATFTRVASAFSPVPSAPVPSVSSPVTSAFVTSNASPASAPVPVPASPVKSAPAPTIAPNLGPSSLPLYPHQLNYRMKVPTDRLKQSANQ